MDEKSLIDRLGSRIALFEKLAFRAQAEGRYSMECVLLHFMELMLAARAALEARQP